MQKNIIILLCFIFSINSYAINYFCHLDTSPKGSVINKSNVKKYIRKFTYKSIPGAKGKRVRFSGFEVIIFNQKMKTSLLVKLPKTKQEIKTSYDLTQQALSFIIKDQAKIKCVTKSGKDKDTISKHIHKELGSNSDLSQFSSDVIIKNKTTLKFKYAQQLVNGLMRPIIFQDGKLLTADNPRRKNADWCVMQIQLKLNEDTFLQKYTKMKPLDFSIVSNNDQRSVYSYSFVDFSSGKKSFETSRYALFSLSCNLTKGVVLTPAIFNQITGDRFEIKLAP